MQLTFGQKEQFFHELGQLARSGISLPAALEMLARSRQAPGQSAGKILQDLKHSNSASAAFLGAGFAASDGAVIEAGESTGRLDQVFAELEAYYQQLAAARSGIIRRSTYSVFVLHFGALLLAVPPAIAAGSVTTYFANVLPVLGAFYGLLVLAWMAWRFLSRTLAGTEAGARMVMLIPIAGGYLTNLTAWKFSLVLSLYVRAGGRMLKAFQLAGASCENAVIRAATERAVPRVQAGATLTDAFCRQPGLPDLLERSIEVGERSGRLDEETQRAAEVYKQRTMRTLDSVARTVPIIVYVLVAGYTAYRIIVMMMGYYASMKALLDQ